MGNPKVDVVFGISNLGIQAADVSGTFGIIASIPVAPTSGYGVAFVIKNKAQAKLALADAANAGILKAITDGFYAEVNEGTPLYLLCLTNTTSLSALADIANNNVTTLNNYAGKKLRGIGLVRFPANGYTPVIVDGFDADVHAAVIKSQAAATAWIRQYKPLEFVVEGRSFTDATAARDYTGSTNAKSSINKNVHVVIGSEDGNSAISVLRALGKKAANAVHRNIGRVKSGSLQIAQDAVVVLGQKTTSVTVAETKATSTVTITAIVGYIYLYVLDASGWYTYLGFYSKQDTDTTPTAVAAAIIAIINSGTATHGYTATSAAAVITITAKAGLGASLNTLNLYTDLGNGFTITKTAWAGGVTATVVLAQQLLETYSTTDLDTLHDKGYITYVPNEDAAGYIFNDDVSLTDPTSDYATWSHNAVIGEAMRIAYAQQYKTLKDDVEVEADGTLGKAIETNLQQDIVDAIEKNLAGSISGVNALVNPDVTASAGLYQNAGITSPNLNLLQAGKLYVFLTVRPKGYIKDVMVVLGFGL